MVSILSNNQRRTTEMGAKRSSRSSSSSTAKWCMARTLQTKDAPGFCKHIPVETPAVDSGCIGFLSS